MKESPVELYKSLDALPEEYLMRNQRDPERAAKAITKAHERRLARNARRLKHAQSCGLIKPVFQLDLRKDIK